MVTIKNEKLKLPGLPSQISTHPGTILLKEFLELMELTLQYAECGGIINLQTPDTRLRPLGGCDPKGLNEGTVSFQDICGHLLNISTAAVTMAPRTASLSCNSVAVSNPQTD